MNSIFKSPESKSIIRDWHFTMRKGLSFPIEEKVVTTSFGETHLLIAGPPDAPPLVALHGALASSSHLLGEMAPLARSFRIYALDVLGQSVMSEDRRLSSKTGEHGQWLNEVFAGLPLESAHLLGVSWGGFASMQFTIQNPEKVKSLSLIVPAGFVAPAHGESLFKMAIPLLLYKTIGSKWGLKAFMKNLFTTSDQQWEAYIADALSHVQMNFELPPNFTDEEIRSISCPWLCLTADQDVSVPGPALARRVKECSPSANIISIPNCRHSPPFTKEFRESLAGWVCETAGVGRPPE